MSDRVIQAVIVNHERTHVIVDADGGLPEMAFSKAEHETFEGTLSALGKEALYGVGYVSVDHGYPHEGKTVYQTKPVPESAEPVAPYMWGEAPLELK